MGNREYYNEEDQKRSQEGIILGKIFSFFSQNKFGAEKLFARFPDTTLVLPDLQAIKYEKGGLFSKGPAHVQPANPYSTSNSEHLCKRKIIFYYTETT